MGVKEVLSIFPEGTKVDASNHLVIGAIKATELLKKYGSPLYVFDEDSLKGKAREFQKEFKRLYPNTQVLYASKAFINRPLARLFGDEGLGIDVVSAGELAIAKAAGFPLERVYFHGNNKEASELEMACDSKIGRIVVDNFHEIELLNQIAKRKKIKQAILLRISPGVDPHTHVKTTTGILDSKFGFALQTGDAEEAVRQAVKASNLNLVGIHIHLGSPIYELEPYELGVKVSLDFVAAMVKKHGLKFEEFSPGGGFAIQYLSNAAIPTVSEYAKTITKAILSNCKRLGLKPPKLVIEPGRAMVGKSGVALYTVGSSKNIPGVRKYVAVDGGMGDNIRPAIYGSLYEALVANHVETGKDGVEKVTIAGKYCESGDILIKDITLPKLKPGDVIAIPASGAYCLAMASNYNAALKPPIVLVSKGKSRLIRRRETYADLMRTDVMD